MNTLKKRIASAFMAAVLAAAAIPPVSAAADFENVDFLGTVVYGQPNGTSGLKNLGSSLTYAGTTDFKTPVLNKSRTLKRTFFLKEGETLIIPKGKTLKLTAGANIDGNIYIEQGGKLILDRFSVGLTGSIVCDGTISVTGGTLTCFGGSLLFIGETGSFNVADTGYSEEYGEFNGRISADANADTVCLGKTNYPDPTFSGEPVAAVKTSVESGGAQLSTELYTGDLSELMPGKVGYSKYYMWSGDYYDTYTVLFDGGSCVKFTGRKDSGWESIGTVSVSWLTAVLDIYRNPENAAKYGEY